MMTSFVTSPKLLELALSLPLSPADAAMQKGLHSATLKRTSPLSGMIPYLQGFPPLGFGLRRVSRSNLLEVNVDSPSLWIVWMHLQQHMPSQKWPAGCEYPLRITLLESIACSARILLRKSLHRFMASKNLP